MTIASQPWTQQLIITLGGIAVVMLPLIYADRRNRRNRRDEADQRYQSIISDRVNRDIKLDKLLRLANGIHDDEQVDGEVTLGSLLRDVHIKVETLDSKLEDGFTRNDEDHRALISTVGAHSELLHAHGQQLDDQRQRIDKIDEHISNGDVVREWIESAIADQHNTPT